ncbi:MAG: Bug family tripartite tricarboxylate transporter substrate binding protein [Burkholderiaceae bacterium]
MIRYRMIGSGIAAVAIALVAGASYGQSPAPVPAAAWPTKPIRYIVPFAPGGTTDILARSVGEKLAIALGQPVVVENKPGQGGSIGAAELARAAPDGYTIGGGTISSHAINATLYDKLSYDPLTSFAPITMYATQPNVLLVHPSVPATTVKEFIVLLKASPTKYSFGSAGNGTSQHVSGELFKTMAGVQMQHIPYRGSGQMMPELLAGTVPVAVDNIATAIPHVKAGKLRALAVTSSTRSVVAPDVPTMAEAGLVGYEISSWQAVFAPAGTPTPIIDRLHTEITKILKSPEIQKRFGELGLDIVLMNPQELAAVIKADVPRLGKIVKESGARAD